MVLNKILLKKNWIYFNSAKLTVRVWNHYSYCFTDVLIANGYEFILL